MKIALQFLISIALFFGIWWAAAQVNWVKLFHVQEVSQKTEKIWGDLLEKILVEDHEILEDQTIYEPVQRLLNHICNKNNLEETDFTLHIVQNPEVNAFALPGGHIVLNSGLLKACPNEASLAGVLGHELAHITQSHVMQKLIRDLGIAVVLGGSQHAGSEVLKKALQDLSSAAYSRSLEKEADLQSVIYLNQAGFPSEEFAKLLMEMEHQQGGLLPAWVQSHPDGEARARYIRQADRKGDALGQNDVISSGEWEALKEGLER